MTILKKISLHEVNYLRKNTPNRVGSPLSIFIVASILRFDNFQKVVKSEFFNISTFQHIKIYNSN